MPQHQTLRQLRWSLLAAPAAAVLVLAGCSGSSDDGGSTTDPEAVGFSLMIAQANDDDDSYARFAEMYTEETGVPIEVIPYPSDAYNTQVTTQLQAGNAADVMILAPGTGQPISVITLADAGFLAPLNETSASINPVGSEAEFQIDGTTYAQATALTPVGMVFNVTAADEAGVTEYPATYEELLADCAVARDAGKTFMVLAGGIPFNTGLFSMLVSATRVYAEDPDWNSQRAAGDVTFADSGWRDVLTDIVEMKDAGCYQDGAEGGTFDSITQGLGGGSSLTAAVPGSAAASIAEPTGSELNVQAFPPANGQDAFTVTSANYAWAINAASSDEVKASAQAFLDWAAEPVNATAFAEMAGWVPITGIDTATLLPQYAPIGDLLANGDYTSLPNATWPNPAVYEALGTGVQGLLTGQTTVDEVLASMDAAWDQ